MLLVFLFEKYDFMKHFLALKQWPEMNKNKSYYPVIYCLPIAPYAYKGFMLIH